MSDPVTTVTETETPAGTGEAAPKGKAAAGKTDPPEPQTFSVEYVRELRNENRGWRLKASETEKKAEAAEAARVAAQAEADKKVADVNTAAEQRIIRAELKAAALKAGMVDVDGLKLADLSKVKMNDKGEVEGADALMDDLKKAKPYLFGTVSTSSTVVPPKPDDNKPKSAKDMTKEEYAAFRAKIIRDSKKK